MSVEIVPPLCFFLTIVTEDTDATNELINDGEFVQPLTVDEIQALKQSGLHVSVCKDFRSLLIHQPIITYITFSGHDQKAN